MVILSLSDIVFAKNYSHRQRRKDCRHENALRGGGSIAVGPTFIVSILSRAHPFYRFVFTGQQQRLAYFSLFSSLFSLL